MIRKPKSFKWAEMDYNAIQLERKISETENIKNNRRRVNEAISFKFKKVVIKKEGKEIPLSTNVIADIIEDIDVQYLSLIAINNALRRNTFSIFKYGERPTDMTIYPDGMVELRYDGAKCYVYLIP